MKLLLLCLVGLALTAPRPARAEDPAQAAESEVETAADEADEAVYWNLPPAMVDGEELLRGVRAALPAVPLRIDAELQSKNPEGQTERVLHAEIRARYSTASADVDVTLRDAFGGDLERMTMIQRPGVMPEYKFYQGNALEPAAVPDLSESILETEVTWHDLGLSFLWWPGARTVDAEKIKGRFCYVVDVSSPSEEPSAGGVRLWIDPKVHVLLQAVAYGPNDQPARLVQVKSLKKLEDMWMVKDLEVKAYPSKRKTMVRVRAVERLDLVETVAPAS